MRSKIGVMLAFWDRQPAWVRYLAPRLAALAICWLLATVAIFTLLFVVHDPADRYPGLNATPQQRPVVRQELGLDHPAPVLYVRWLGDMFHGDLGHDYYLDRSVASALRVRLQGSVELLIGSLALGILAGVAIDYTRRAWNRPIAEGASDLVAVVAASVPVFVLGIFILILPLVHWGYSPPIGRVSPFYRHPLANLQQFGPPWAAVALPVCLLVFLELRSISQRPRLGTVARLITVGFPMAASGAIVAEQIFTIPGIGQYLLVHALFADVFALRTTAALIALLALVVWLAPPRAGRSEQGEGAVLYKHPPRLPVLADVGIMLVVAFVVAGIVGPFVAPYGPNDFRAGFPNESASWSHWLGTDSLGRDELTRVLYGARTALRFSAAVVFLGTLPGLVAGVAIGRYAKRVVRFVPEISGAWVSIPWLMVLLLVAAAFPGRLQYVTGALAVGAFLAALGVSRIAAERDPHHEDWRTVTRACAPSAIDCALAAAGLAVLAEATLGYFGLSVGSPLSASWGGEIAHARNVFPLREFSLWVLAAPLCLTLFGIHLLRTSLRSWWRPPPASAPDD